ncbi:MAG: efflux RND transporter permease subunit [Azovibrio sp.]
MNVSTWSIRNPIPAAMLFVLLTFGGILAFNSLKIQNFPDIDLPIVTVVAALPGASPEQLENDVARKLEDAVASLQGLKHISTRIQEGGVTLTLEFQLEKHVQEAVDDTRSAVQKVRADLPSDVRDPVVQRLDMASQPILVFAIRSDQMDDEALSWFVDNTIARRLLSVKGVGAVTRVGGVTRQVHVALDPSKLQSLGISAAEVSRQIRLVQQDAASGRADLGSSEQTIRTLGGLGTAQEIAALQIPVTDGRYIRLDQVATITDTVAEIRSSATLDGKPVVGFEISRSRGESEVEVGAGVRQSLKQLKAEMPHIQLTEAFDFVTPVHDEYKASLNLLYEGALLAVIVVWFFLKEWRATLISAVALPLSVIPTFLGLMLFGFSINVVSLLALSLVVGVLVDDAIVEIENIVRHLRMGKTPYQAAMEAADEIGLAVVATTFTLIAVFLPTAFMSGIAGKFFKEFGWTASIAVFASLVVARVLTPMMAAYMLKPLKQSTEDPRWMKTYMKAASWCIHNPKTTLVFSGLFFMGSLALIPLLPTGFMPPDDNSQTQVFLELPPGSTLSQTEQIAEQTRLLLTGTAHVRSVYTTIGGGTAGADPFAGASTEPRKATLTIQLSERSERPKKQVIEAEIRTLLEQIPGVRTKVGLGGSGEKYILVLTGEDPESLQNAALAVQQDLRTIDGLGSIISTASLVRPEIAVRPDFARAADLGVTSAAIGETLRVATLGDYDMSLAKLNLPQRQLDVVVKLEEDARRDISVLERLTVPGTRGPVMLGQVADLEISSGPAVIDRYDRSRNINIETELSGMPLGDVAALVKELPSIRNLPPGVALVEIGDAEVMMELFENFALAMLTGLICVYVVLVLLFKNFLHPVTILAALPLALGGAFVALLVTHKSFSMPSLIGLVMLMGIATKNSILLVEYAIVARRGNDGSDGRPVVAGMSRLDALLDACHKRARPIIMTTIAMGAGMLPIAIGLGNADPSFRSPMAIAVIGGLITSTILSLLVIPVVFSLLDELSQWVFRHVFRRHTHTT